MKKCGVYYIRCAVDGAVYVGSSVDLVRRFATHRWELRNNKHSNAHLQAAWNKYGEHNFSLEVVELCSQEMMFQREQYYLDAAYAVAGANIYNLTAVAKRPTMSNEARERLRQRMMGNTYTLGHKRTPEQRLATKIGNIGKVRTPEQRERYRQAALKREAAKKLRGYFPPPWEVK